MMDNRVTITDGRRDNLKTTTPMWCRTITKTLQGKRCPSRLQIINKLRKEALNETWKEADQKTKGID